jgi:transposase
MNKKNRMELSYNIQLTVHYNSEIILSNSVTQDPTNHQQLIPQIKQNKGPLPDYTTSSANNGHYTKTKHKKPNKNITKSTNT